MRENPFKRIYDICNQGNSREKLNHLPEFPIYIDIELTNSCNFNCLMCPTGTGTVKRQTGFIKDKVFFKVLDEIKEYNTPVRFIRWGEPTLHPKWLQYIREVKKQDMLCHINTNGSLLNSSSIKEIVDIKLDSIKFSFQGVSRKSYKEMRNKDYYKSLLKKIAELYKARGEKELPYIHVSTTITYESKEEVDAFKKEMQNIVDLVTVGRTVLEHIDVDRVKLKGEALETLKWLKEQESVVKVHTECPEVFDKLSINWDGTVSACCGDYDNKMIVGNVMENSLKEIWVSEKMNLYRKMLANMEHDKLELCKSCYDYHGIQVPGLQKI